MTQWITKIPGRVWVALGLLLLAAFWLEQHDARIRQQAQLKQMKQQTADQVAALKKQAAQDITKANVENAQAIQQLEARRRQIEQQNQQLAAQLAALRKQEQIQVGEVATLPITEIATRVATQLGFDSEDTASSRQGAKAQSMTAGPGSHGTGFRAVGSSADIAQSATSAPAEKATAASRQGAKAQSKAATPGGGDTAATKAVAMALTASGARKVEAALVELNACLAQSNVQTQQVSSCQAQAAADEAVIQKQAGSIASLNQALQAKDKILNQQETEYKAELRAVKGTFWSRVARTAKHVAIGVAVGVAIGVAAR